MVSSRSGQHSLWFVTHDDIIAMVKSEGVRNLAVAQKRAQEIWVKDCFTLELYLDADGIEATHAEFVCEWLHSGYTLADSIAYLATLRETTRKRSLPPTSRQEAMKRARQNVDKTYTPKVASGLADGGDAS